MLVEFTNIAGDHTGSKIYINPEHVTVVYEMPSQTGGSLVTCIWSALGNVTWNVEEGLNDTIKKINGVKN